MSTARSLTAQAPAPIAVTSAIADWVAGLGYEDLPSVVVAGAKRSFLDTLGVTLGGVAEEAPRILGKLARDTGGKPAATLIGQGFQSDTLNATLANGTAGDVIGYSDLCVESLNHVSNSVLSALWALAEARGTSGREIILAHSVGMEVAEKIGQGFGYGFQRRGWHLPGILNTFGAAAACGKLLGFNADQIGNALGIAGAGAAGVRAVKGTMCKAYEAGRSGRDGLAAVLLTEAGFTGPKDVLEARDGIIQTFGAGEFDATVVGRLGNPFEFDQPGITYKAFPLCTCTHPAVVATLRLREEHGVHPEAVDSIVCGTTQCAADWLPFTLPTGKLQAKYSMPFAVALTLVAGRPTLANVVESALQDIRIARLMRKITMTVLPDYAEHGYVPKHAPFGARVSVRTVDGRELSIQVDKGPWEPATPPSWEALAEKYRDCAAAVLPNANIDLSIEFVERLETLTNISPLMDLVRG